MTLDDFRKTLTAASPPAAMASVLVALWHDARGDWDKAHEVAQDVRDPKGAWVHAYLHRKEGDDSNAAYWYQRAGKPIARTSLAAEWEAIVTAFLE